jgi:hypothetical protein
VSSLAANVLPALLKGEEPTVPLDSCASAGSFAGGELAVDGAGYCFLGIGGVSRLGEPTLLRLLSCDSAPPWLSRSCFDPKRRPPSVPLLVQLDRQRIRRKRYEGDEQPVPEEVTAA